MFSSLIQNNCPLYFQPALEGVHCGVKLLDVCLRILAPELHLFLESKGLSTKVYGFPAVMTFCACVKPLSQVLILWDFLLASGVHLNIVCICAQLMMIQSELMDSKRSFINLI